MKNTLCSAGVALLFCASLTFVPSAQLSAQVTEEEVETVEASAPLDDFTTGRHIIAERTPLKHAPVREADVLWEKRIWRVIDTREKMNLAFTAPQSPLFTILRDAVEQGGLKAYSSESDKFDIPLSQTDLKGVLHQVDTISVVNIETGEEETQVVSSDLNWEDVKRFRVKEVWWFDKNVGALRQRILGVAPMIDVKDENGEFLYERPLFWVHYPSARAELARHQAIASDNVSAAITWEDLFEKRQFSSYITKESNVQDRRLQDYLAGVDLLMEGSRIKDELFNLEHDLWSW